MKRPMAARASPPVRADRGELEQEPDATPVEERADHAEAAEEAAAPVAPADAVHDVEDDADADHGAARGEGEADDRHRIGLDEVVEAPVAGPEGVLLEALQTEEAAVDESEEDAGRAGEGDEDADVARLRPLRREDDGEAGEEEHEAVARVAEHHAEHEHVGDGDEEGRLQVVVARGAVARDEHLEGAQEPGVAHQHRDLEAGDVVGRERLDSAAAFRDLREAGRHARGVRFGHPAGDERREARVGELLLGLEDAPLGEDGGAQGAEFARVAGGEAAAGQGEVGKGAVGRLGLLAALGDHVVERLAFVEDDRLPAEARLLEGRLHGEAARAARDGDDGRVVRVARQRQEDDVVRDLPAEVVELSGGEGADGEVEEGEGAEFGKGQVDVLEGGQLLQHRPHGGAAGVGLPGAGAERVERLLDGLDAAFGLAERDDVRRGGRRGVRRLGGGGAGLRREAFEQGVDARDERVAAPALGGVVGRRDRGGLRSGLSLDRVDDAEVAEAAEHGAFVAGEHDGAEIEHRNRFEHGVPPSAFTFPAESAARAARGRPCRGGGPPTG